MGTKLAWPRPKTAGVAVFCVSFPIMRCNVKRLNPHLLLCEGLLCFVPFNALTCAQMRPAGGFRAQSLTSQLVRHALVVPNAQRGFFAEAMISCDSLASLSGCVNG